jgi:hypothetical protein
MNLYGRANDAMHHILNLSRQTAWHPSKHFELP